MTFEKKYLKLIVHKIKAVVGLQEHNVCTFKGGFKSEDTGELILQITILSRKFKKSTPYSNFLLSIMIWNIYVGYVKILQYLLT